MKKRNNRLTAAMAVVLTMIMASSCKTNESNYRAAYDTVVAHQKQMQGDLDTPGLQATGTAAPKPTEVSNGVVLPLATEWLGSATKEADVTKPGEYKRYNVAVARFRQVFNARQMKGRLVAGGYPGATILKSKDAYYVSAFSTNMPDSALTELNRVKADTSLSLKTPFPYVIRPGHMAR
ncbi:MAG: hypothetical protein NC484_02485 [Alloprevotella sp.]|nr:hypothetical protein [Alloprevotella sp.]